jgi:hypothetical protein
MWGEIMSYYSEIIRSFWESRRFGGNLLKSENNMVSRRKKCKKRSKFVGLIA